ncbi:MAG TPA: cyclic-di-AMP receptor [Clostridia bacterium]|nr:cyclic-di-AMP receptor [Clostridia bacterium]
MKLLIIIMQEDDVNRVVNRLNKEKIGVTRLASSGGFLRRGNTTILIGAKDDQVELIKDVIREKCRSRVEMMPSIPVIAQGIITASEPIEVRVGGAIYFQVDVEEFQKF